MLSYTLIDKSRGKTGKDAAALQQAHELPRRAAGVLGWRGVLVRNVRCTRRIEQGFLDARLAGHWTLPRREFCKYANIRARICNCVAS